MSIIVETFIICDGNCGTTSGVDFRSLSGKEHRQVAKENGWTHKRGKDYCPECNKKIKDNPESLTQQP